MEIIGEGTRSASPQERELLTGWATGDFNISASQFRLFCNSALNKYNRHLKKRGFDKKRRIENSELAKLQQLLNNNINKLVIKSDLYTVKIESRNLINQIVTFLDTLPKAKQQARPGRPKLAKRDLFVMQLIRDCQDLFKYNIDQVDNKLFYFAGLVLSYIGLTNYIKKSEGIKDVYINDAVKLISNVYYKNA